MSNRRLGTWRWAVGLIALLGLLASACGSSSDSATPEVSTPEPTAPATAAVPDAATLDTEADVASDTDVEVPPNDLLANVVVIDPAALPFTDAMNTNAATSDEDDANVGCPSPENDASVWYSITPTIDMRLSVSAEGSDFPAGVSAASGEPGSLQLIECRPFAFVVEAEANVTYHFQVFDGEDPSSQGGNLVFRVEEAPELVRESTEGLAPLGQEFVETVAGDIEVTDGAFMFAVVDAHGEAVAGSNGVDGDGNAPTATDVFRIGSITKVFTSAATLTLVEDGVVDLDAPASRYVSRVPVPDDVTVRDLLRHTSGIYNYTDDPDFIPSTFDAPDRFWTPEEVVAVVVDQPSLFEPGSEFRYSNTNYVILGVLIEEVTGQQYHEVLRERIISPLGLSSTYLAGFEGGPEVFDPYEHEGDADYDYTSVASGAWSAGAMVSSAGDLHTLFTALFDEEIVSSDLVAQMIDGTEYGFGMELFQSGEGLFGHGGGIPGYVTFVLHSPESGVTGFLVSTDPVADNRYAIDKMFEGFAALASD